MFYDVMGEPAILEGALYFSPHDMEVVEVLDMGNAVGVDDVWFILKQPLDFPSAGDIRQFDIEEDRIEEGLRAIEKWERAGATGKAFEEELSADEQNAILYLVYDMHGHGYTGAVEEKQMVVGAGTESAGKKEEIAEEWDVTGEPVVAEGVEEAVTKQLELMGVERPEEEDEDEGEENPEDDEKEEDDDGYD